MLQYVIDLGLLKEIIPLVERVKSTVTMKESTWLLSNILAGTQEQIQAVINAGLLPYLKEVLKSVSQQDSEVLNAINGNKLVSSR